MLTETMTGASTLSSNSISSADEGGAGEGGQAGGPALRVRRGLAACCEPAVTLADREELRAALRVLGESVAQLSRRQVESDLVAESRALIRGLAEVGAHDLGVSELDLNTARLGLTQGWPGLLAAMLLVPAWQLPDAPLLGGVPDWLWGEYSAWLFAPPRHALIPGVATHFASHALPHLEELNRWVGRNAGSAAVRAAVEAYLASASGQPWHGAGGADRRHAEVRGQILTRFLARANGRYDPLVRPRDGRLLRVGFVSHDFGPRPETYAALAGFEQLDPQGFEVFLFPLHESATAEARYCDQHAKARHVLPADHDLQLKLLREAALDIVFFCGDPGNRYDEVTRLALHRVAHLQVVNQRSGLTCGLPEIDLFISGDATATPETAVQFSERLGVVRGAGHAFSFPNSRAADPGTVTRASLGLPDEATLFATVVTPAGIAYETFTAWADLLAQAPRLRLLVIFATPTDDPTPHLARFCAALETVFAGRGATTDNVSIFPVSADSSEGPRGILRVASLYLDSLSGLAPERVAEALALGLPALVLGQPAAAGRGTAAQLLHSCVLSELVAPDAAAYVRKAVELATDGASLDALRAGLRVTLKSGPAFLDSLAASDALGALLETAFDELTALGRPVFRAETEPLRCFSADNPAAGLDAGFAAQAAGDLFTAAFEANLALRSDPLDARGRHLRGLVFLAEGNVPRAVDYLMAALPRFAGEADYWFTLAGALRRNGQVPQAIEALETSLRLNGRRVEPLLMLIELAEAVGAADIARQTLQWLQEIAPDDPRVLAMS